MSKEFLLDFIKCLRNEPSLWHAQSDAYKNKTSRNKSWKVLLNKLKEVDEQATLETVKKKVNSLRASYRRERQKIKRSEKAGAEIYKPSIWYFKELNFLNYQKSSVDGIKNVDDDREIEMPKSYKRKCNDEAKFIDLDNINTKKPRDDADIYAEGWAVMFRQLSNEQQLFAKKGIDELLMQGRMDMLTYPAVLSIANFPNKQYYAAPVYQMPEGLSAKFSREHSSSE